jgi:TetR/AcrR family transcriptional repressor of nem operon
MDRLVQYPEILWTIRSENARTIFDRKVHKCIRLHYCDLMTTATPTDRGRGRPREFDEDQVLDALVQLFWQRGFEAASMADIVEAAGLHKSSIYNAFGSKEELFQKALDRYIETRSSLLDEATSGDGGLEDVLTIVEILRRESLSEVGCWGCLAVNASTELGMSKEFIASYSKRYRDRLAEYFRRPLARAASRGQIAVDLVDVYVDTGVAFLTTSAISARAGASDAELNRYFDSMRRIVESWRDAADA